MKRNIETKATEEMKRYTFHFRGQNGEDITGKWDDGFPFNIVADADVLLLEMLRDYDDGRRSIMVTSVAPYVLTAMACTAGYEQHIPEYDRQDDIVPLDGWLERDGEPIFQTKIEVGAAAGTDDGTGRAIWCKQVVPPQTKEMLEVVTGMADRLTEGAISLDDAKRELAETVKRAAESLTSSEEFRVLNMEEQSRTFEELTDRERKTMMAICQSVNATIRDVLQDVALG